LSAQSRDINNYVVTISFANGTTRVVLKRNADGKFITMNPKKLNLTQRLQTCYQTIRSVSEKFLARNPEFEHLVSAQQSVPKPASKPPKRIGGGAALVASAAPAPVAPTPPAPSAPVVVPPAPSPAVASAPTAPPVPMPSPGPMQPFVPQPYFGPQPPYWMPPYMPPLYNGGHGMFGAGPPSHDQSKSMKAQMARNRNEGQFAPSPVGYPGFGYMPGYNGMAPPGHS
jgi:hypothetical protein